MATPTSKASMDANFELRLREMRQQAATEAAARATGLAVPWMRPGAWQGNPFDFEAMSEPFARDGANQSYLDAVADPQSPGVVGDVVAATTMLETLGAMQQAFAMRHTLRRPRAMAHTIGRKRGHGQATGPLTTNYLEYLRAVLAQAKQTP